MTGEHEEHEKTLKTSSSEILFFNDIWYINKLSVNKHVTYGENYLAFVNYLSS